MHASGANGGEPPAFAQHVKVLDNSAILNPKHSYPSQNFSQLLAQFMRMRRRNMSSIETCFRVKNCPCSHALLARGVGHHVQGCFCHVSVGMTRALVLHRKFAFQSALDDTHLATNPPQKGWLNIVLTF